MCDCVDNSIMCDCITSPDTSERVYSRIQQDVIDLLRGRIINLSRYQIKWEEFTNGDAVCEFADTKMSDRSTLEFLKGKAIISDVAVFDLAEDIGLEIICDEDAWVDRIIAHIFKHESDCKELWNFIIANADIAKE